MTSPAGAAACAPRTAGCPGLWPCRSRVAVRVARESRPPAASEPAQEFSRELALLHSCRVRLPHTKAEARLGYRPIVTFEEACRRSVAWLRLRGLPGAMTRAPTAAAPVAVVIPTYNHAHFLGDAIASVLRADGAARGDPRRRRRLTRPPGTSGRRPPRRATDPAARTAASAPPATPDCGPPRRPSSSSWTPTTSSVPGPSS